VHCVVTRREISIYTSSQDDLSGYLWLMPCQMADAAATVEALMRWVAVFDVLLLWISDRWGHFKNEIVRQVQNDLRANHNFTTTNCAWSNGTVESTCKIFIRAYRAVLSDTQTSVSKWVIWYRAS
jgi:hypothetical protein